jgi:hypothetical protein
MQHVWASSNVKSLCTASMLGAAQLSISQAKILIFNFFSHSIQLAYICIIIYILFEFHITGITVVKLRYRVPVADVDLSISVSDVTDCDAANGKMLSRHI